MNLHEPNSSYYKAINAYKDSEYSESAQLCREIIATGTQDAEVHFLSMFLSACPAGSIMAAVGKPKNIKKYILFFIYKLISLELKWYCNKTIKSENLPGCAVHVGNVAGIIGIKFMTVFWENNKI